MKPLLYILRAVPGDFTLDVSVPVTKRDKTASNVGRKLPLSYRRAPTTGVFKPNFNGFLAESEAEHGEVYIVWLGEVVGTLFYVLLRGLHMPYI